MTNKGKAWVYGDNVDTDVIIPARYLNTPDPAEYSKFCMQDIDKNFSNEVQQGDVIVAGENFGCGSSREHAPIAIKTSGVSAVIAKSFARIFFRNAINIGLVILKNDNLPEEVSKGDEIEIDVQNGVIINLTTGKSYTTTAYTGSIKELIDAGGLVNYTKERIANDK